MSDHTQWWWTSEALCNSCPFSTIINHKHKTAYVILSSNADTRLNSSTERHMYKPLQEIRFENTEELLFRICLGDKTFMPYIMENRKWGFCQNQTEYYYCGLKTTIFTLYLDLKISSSIHLIFTFWYLFDWTWKGKKLKKLEKIN